ncbi:DUF2142 domain-containing protein [Archangium violaceum]|uniref:DUF2142 domain-containing protein n=1 Tax=Archangium violaceum TaxID=83451 RepID=UPI002B2B71E9|nr:DUF2142 domain-containing protein [Archangium gephyra]
MTIAAHTEGSSAPPRGFVHPLLQSMRREKAVWGLFILCVVLSLRVSSVTPPFQNPDESAHYLRAYEISQGHFVNWRGHVGADMSCADYVVVAKQYGPVANFQQQAVDNLGDPACTVKSINTAGLYPAPGYLLSGLMLKVGEWKNWSAPAKLKAARKANGLVGCLFMLVGLLSIQHFRVLFAWACLLPMSFWQRSALSTDSLLLGAAFLFVCWVVRLVEREQRPTRADWAVLLGTAALIGSTKGLYGVICASALVLLWQRPPEMGFWKWAAMLSTPGLVAIGVAGAWAKVGDPSLIYLGNGANPGAQLAFMGQHPGQFLGILFGQMGVMSKDWFRQMVAFFSWLPLDLGMSLTWMLTGLLIPLLATQTNPFNRPQRAVLLGTVLMGTLASIVPLYLTYNPPGYQEILGVQGRYFLPLVPLLFMAVAFEKRESIQLSPSLRTTLGMGLPFGVLTWLTVTYLR